MGKEQAQEAQKEAVQAKPPKMTNLAVTPNGWAKSMEPVAAVVKARVLGGYDGDFVVMRAPSTCWVDGMGVIRWTGKGECTEAYTGTIVYESKFDWNERNKVETEVISIQIEMQNVEVE